MRRKLVLGASDRPNDRQLAKLRELWEQSPDDYASFEHARMASWIGYDGILFVRWCDMTIGIERDGYAHS